MKRVRFQGLALGFARDPQQGARPPGVDRHLDAEHREGDVGEGDQFAAGLQPLDRLHGDAAGQQKQQGGLGQRGDAFDLAVPVVMLGVGRPVGNAHGEPGHERRAQVDQAVQRVGNQRQAADRDAHGELHRGERPARDDGDDGNFFLLARHGALSSPIAAQFRLCRMLLPA